MNDEQLLRYSRQIMLPQIDLEGQDKLLDSTALIVGMGGLGAPAAMYLAAAGVGHLIIVDFDTVELSNLQRQVIHSTNDIDKPKVESASQRLTALNPDIKITRVNHKLDEDGLLELVHQSNVVLDGTDNFTTRFMINRCCVKAGKPLVSGAAIRMEGQVGVFNLTSDSACYHCLYKDTGEEMDTSCSENGVLAPVVGIIGSIQATEAIKVLLNIGEVLDGRLLLLDALSMEPRILKLRKDPKCSVCN